MNVDHPAKVIFCILVRQSSIDSYIGMLIRRRGSKLKKRFYSFKLWQRMMAIVEYQKHMYGALEKLFIP